MTYAGDGLFSREEDVYNPLRFVRMSVQLGDGSPRRTATSATRAGRTSQQFGG